MSIVTMLTPPALRARLTGRSLWSLRFTDGRIVTEGEVDWSLAPLKGRQSIRLYCPDGRVAELGNTEDATGRIFQLKAGMLLAGAGRTCAAHLIGIITRPDGSCRIAAWEYGPGRLVTFEDNVHAMRYGQIGALGQDVLGLKV